MGWFLKTSWRRGVIIIDMLVGTLLMTDSKKVASEAEKIITL
jgi:hypothetical protein